MLHVAYDPAAQYDVQVEEVNISGGGAAAHGHRLQPTRWWAVSSPA